MIKPLLIALTVLLALPNFIDKDINEQLPFNHTERFHPTLTAINSIDKLESYVDMVAATRNFDVKGEGYPLLLSYIISCRFYHGFSHWKLNENWIAAAGERITGIGLSCKVQPNEILKNPYAACSQQALVMMEILKRKKIDYRKVGFPHHYAIEVKVKDEWYYYDPNMEPTMNLKQRMHESWNQNNDSLKKYYDPLKHDNLSYQFGNGEVPIFGPVNETPAKNLRLFQTATSLMSKFLWCIPLLLLLVISSRTRMRAVKPLGNTTLIPIS